MAKFRFELDPLLRARQREEDVVKLEVARLEQARTSLEDALRGRQARLSDSKRSSRGHLVGQLEVSAVRMQANASLAIMRDAQRAVLELAGLHRQLEQAREVLREAAKKRRAVELLREQKVDDWRRAEGRAEQAALDELSTNRSSRERREDIL
ncbi:MAG: flagellar export protein FliJ [Phycisphaerales bacterium]|nr:flagellar export protein FliJ [Phycisphaerales bacterium]